MEYFKKYIPNILSVLRLPLAFLCVYYTYSLKPVFLIISLALFMIASFTDYLDGYLARKWKIVSKFGKIMDPIADKVLILGVMFIFSYEGVIPWVLTVIIASREIFVTAIRFIMLSKKIVLASMHSGKVKTFSQVIALVGVYVLLIVNSWIDVATVNIVIKNIILLMILWVAGISIYSCVDFLNRNRRILSKHI